MSEDKDKSTAPEAKEWFMPKAGFRTETDFLAFMEKAKTVGFDDEKMAEFMPVEKGPADEENDEEPPSTSVDAAATAAPPTDNHDNNGASEVRPSLVVDTVNPEAGANNMNGRAIAEDTHTADVSPKTTAAAAKQRVFGALKDLVRSPEKPSGGNITSPTARKNTTVPPAPKVQRRKRKARSENNSPATEAPNLRASIQPSPELFKGPLSRLLKSPRVQPPSQPPPRPQIQRADTDLQAHIAERRFGGISGSPPRYLPPVSPAFGPAMHYSPRPVPNSNRGFYNGNDPLSRPRYLPPPPQQDITSPSGYEHWHQPPHPHRITLPPPPPNFNVSPRPSPDLSSLSGIRFRAPAPPIESIRGRRFQVRGNQPFLEYLVKYTRAEDTEWVSETELLFSHQDPEMNAFDGRYLRSVNPNVEGVEMRFRDAEVEEGRPRLFQRGGMEQQQFGDGNGQWIGGTQGQGARVEWERNGGVGIFGGSGGGTGRGV